MTKLLSKADMPSNTPVVSSAEGEERQKSNVILETESTTESSVSVPAPENLLEKDLQSALKPLNLMLAMFFLAKYKIRENMISTNRAIYDVISVVAALTILCGHFCLTLGTFSTKLDGFEFILHLTKWNAFLLFILFSLLSCYTNIIEKDSNVLFVTRIQDVYRILKIYESFQHFILPNWVCVIALNCYHISWMVYNYFLFRPLGIANTFASYCFICVDMYILYASRLMKLMLNPLQDWIKNVQMSEFVKNSLNDFYWKTMFEVYMKIIDAYKLFEKTTHLFVRINNESRISFCRIYLLHLCHSAYEFLITLIFVSGLILYHTYNL